jgi:chromosome segregation ATPase
MSDQAENRGLRDRIASGTEDALGKLAQDLLENPLIHGAITRAFDAREKATQAQEVAMGALNLPSAADIERLTRRLRSVSQRLEGIEDSLDRLDRGLGQLASGPGAESRLEAIEEQLAVLNRQVGELRDGLPGASSPVSPAQERLRVEGEQGAEPDGAAASGSGRSRGRR